MNIKLSAIIFLSTLCVAATARSRNGGSCQNEGFFPDPQNCAKFYRCVDFGPDVNGAPKFTKFEFQCGDDTVFDELLSVCNHRFAVDPAQPCILNENRPDPVQEKPIVNDKEDLWEWELEPKITMKNHNVNQIGQTLQQVSLPTFQVFRPALNFNPIQMQAYRAPLIYYPVSHHSAQYSHKK